MRDVRNSLKAAGFTALVGALALILPWPGQPLRRLSYDLPLVLGKSRPPTEALVVYLDDASHQQLHQRHGAPWDRRLHAQLITNLLSLGASVVAMDIVFEEPGTDPSADSELAQVIQAGGGKVVLAALINDSQPGIRRLDQPLPIFRNPGDDNWGVANLLADPDGVVRRHFHFDPEWKDLISLSWRAAMQVRPALNQAPRSREQLRWIRYYGPPGTLVRLSYFEALSPTNRQVAELVRGRAVFVGAGSAAGYTGQLMESVPTPFTRGDGLRAAKVDVHATEYLNLVRDDWLRSPGAFNELLFVVIVGAGIGFVLSLFRPGMAIGLGVAAGLFSTVSGVNAINTGNEWFSWTVVSFVEIPLAVVCALAFRRSRPTAARQWDGTTEFTPAAEAEIATRNWVQVPDHELLRCVGRGSYGEVWLARTAMGAYRAVKIVRRRAFGEDKQFEREFAGLERVEPVSRLHEGLVDILQVGKGPAGDYFYYVMELADDAGATTSKAGVLQPDLYQARTLRSLIEQSGRLPLDQCIQIGLGLTAALDFLHGRGLVHRDIKPANIIFIDGTPRLADIGLIAALNDTASMVGTVGYIPPEGPGTPRADLYSLGMVLYELMSGWEHRRFPEFPADALDGPDPLRSTSFAALILKSSASKPDDRFPSAQAVRTELLRIQGNTPRAPKP